MKQKIVILLLLGYSCLASAQSDIRISALSGVTRINLSWVSSPVKEKITPFFGLGFKYHVTPQKHPNLIGTIGINVFQKHNVLKYPDPGFLDTGNTFYSASKSKVSFFQFEMPLMLGYKINKLSLYASTAVIVNTKGNNVYSYESTKDGITEKRSSSTKVGNIEPLSINLVCLCSYSLSEKWSAGLLYSRTMTDFYDADLSNSKSRNNVFGISIDYRLKTF
jgi:hypothetical protein